jgi:Flp pilus assembly pilin Flp
MFNSAAAPRLLFVHGGEHELLHDRMGPSMKILQRLVSEEDGQGLIEYTLILFFVAFVIWIAIKDTTAGALLTNNWSRITDCVSAPFSCGS